MYNAYNFVYVCKLSKTTSFVHIKYKVNTLLNLHKDILARVHSYSMLLYLGCLSNFSIAVIKYHDQRQLRGHRDSKG